MPSSHRGESRKMKRIVNNNIKTIPPHRTVVTTFSPSSVQQHDDEYYNSCEYILSIASSSSSSSHVAAALSDKSIVFYDASSSINHGNNAAIHRIEKAHDGPISEIEFFPSSSSSLLISAGHDGCVKVWDLRCRNTNNNIHSNNSSLCTKLALPKEKALCISLGFGGNLAAVGTDKARISFFDLRCATSSSPTPTGDYHHRSGALLASYVDAHTEEVTKVCFQTTTATSSSSSSVQGEKTVLASASEDGLIALHDPSQPTEEAALLSVLNIGIPTRSIGFFGPNYEGLYALTGSESMSVHHWDSGQRICDVGGGMGLRDVLSDAVVKQLMSRDDDDGNKGMKRMTMSDGGNSTSDDGNKNTIEYLVGCTWAPQVPMSSSTSSTSSFPALHLLAGNSNGDGYLFQVDADRITPLVHMKGGHKGCIRDFSWVECHSNGNNYYNSANNSCDDSRGSSRLLVTGGEDARLCEWDVYGIGSDSDRDNIHHRGSRIGDGGGPILSGRGGRSNQDSRSKSSHENHRGEGVTGRKGKNKFGSPY